MLHGHGHLRPHTHGRTHGHWHGHTHARGGKTAAKKINRRKSGLTTDGTTNPAIRRLAQRGYAKKFSFIIISVSFTIFALAMIIFVLI